MVGERRSLGRLLECWDIGQFVVSASNSQHSTCVSESISSRRIRSAFAVEHEDSDREHALCDICWTFSPRRFGRRASYRVGITPTCGNSGSRELCCPEPGLRYRGVTSFGRDVVSGRTESCISVHAGLCRQSQRIHFSFASLFCIPRSLCIGVIQRLDTF